MRMTDIIAAKRDGRALTPAEIAFVVKGAADGSLPDYQLSAWLMAVYFNKMTPDETVCYAKAMSESGEQIDLSRFGDTTVDKHSTGGVGDKTTLVCAPIAAALGCRVAKMSGRGLGHTGGTADKLASISGYRTAVSKEEFLRITAETGLCLASSSKTLCPADKRLYALRDVTATVDCIPLIAASVMSKKIASGAKNILLDVKYGRGAFMKTPEEAETLAREMVRIGTGLGRNTRAVITDMEIPLGTAVGNCLEVKEAMEILKGRGDERLKEICLILAAHMAGMCLGTDYETAYRKAALTLQDGSAFAKFCEMTACMGGDVGLLTGEHAFPEAQSHACLTAETDGFVTVTDSEKIGKASVVCGAGRETLDSEIDPCAGILLQKQYGCPVKKGEVLAVAYGKPERLTQGLALLKEAFIIGKEKPEPRPAVYAVVNGENA